MSGGDVVKPRARARSHCVVRRDTVNVFQSSFFISSFFRKLIMTEKRNDMNAVYTKKSFSLGNIKLSGRTVPPRAREARTRDHLCLRRTKFIDGFFFFKYWFRAARRRSVRVPPTTPPSALL